MSNIQAYSKSKQSSKIKTDYEPIFCDLYIEYAREFINPDGFWGKYNIDESMKEIWIKEYPDFKKAVALIPNITIDVLNQGVKKVLEGAAAHGDIKTITQIMLKMIDFQFRTGKESGDIKDKARTNKMAKDSSDLSMDADDEDSARDFMNKYKENL